MRGKPTSRSRRSSVTEHGLDAVHVEELGLLRARDPVIFAQARSADRLVVIVTKDDDFPKLLGQHGSPPQVVCQ